MNQGLLKQALVHRSYLNEQDGEPLDSYERMEFLGDAVLELVKNLVAAKWKWGRP